MSGPEDDIGKVVHCRELSSGRFRSGTLHISDKEIATNLFAYGERYIEVDGRQPIHLQTQNLNIVSLHTNTSSGGTAFRRSDDPRLTGLYHTQIQSFVAVIGPSPWLTSDFVKRTYFEIKDVDFILNHLEKKDRLADTKLGDEVDFNLLEVDVPGLRVRIDYGATYSSLRHYPSKIFATLSIDFDFEQTLGSYMNAVASVASLFAASTGLPLRADNIHIMRDTMAQDRARIKNDDYRAPHRVSFPRPELSYDKTLVWAGTSFLLANDDGELDALKACLSTWIARNSEWKEAEALMMQALALRHEISAHRFLNACRWFEEIPSTGAERVIPDHDIQEIITAASAKAAALGHTKIGTRIAGSLNQVGTEAQRDRFERLLETIRKKIGRPVVEDGIIDDLIVAMRLRGQAAHGYLGPDTEEELISIARPLFAMEAFCFLLTVRDLPMSPEGRMRVSGHPILQHYRFL